MSARITPTLTNDDLVDVSTLILKWFKTKIPQNLKFETTKGTGLVYHKSEAQFDYARRAFNRMLIGRV
jgi:hypothetical protein